MKMLKMNRARSNRGPNFSIKDRALLLSILRRYLNIIDNKKTDGVWVKLKVQAWQRVTNEFNSSTTEIARNAHQLKVAYQNYKRRVKKPTADDKTDVFKFDDASLKRKMDEGAEELVTRLKVHSADQDNHTGTNGHCKLFQGEPRETDQVEDSLLEVLCDEAVPESAPSYDSSELHTACGENFLAAADTGRVSAAPLSQAIFAEAHVGAYNDSFTPLKSRLAECTSTKTDFNELRCKLMLEKHELEMEILKTNLKVAQVELKIKEGVLAKQNKN